MIYLGLLIGFCAGLIAGILFVVMIYAGTSSAFR